VLRHLESKLQLILQIGLTDWSSSKEFDNLHMAKWFFAPTAAESRYKEWGMEKTTAMIAESLESFIKEISNHIQIQKISTLEHLEDHYLAFLSGSIDPAKGVIFEP
jgi:hypothetical protein